MKTNAAEFEELIGICFKELAVASQSKYEPEKAERTAALALQAQMQLAYFIEDIELKARHSKSEIERIEAEKYFDIKTAAVGAEKKLTEGFLAQSVAKDKDVAGAKMEAAAGEASLNKYKYLMNSLKDMHIFFRSLAKSGSAGY